MPPGVRGTGPTPGGRPAHCLFLDNPNSPSRVWGLARALWALALLACAKGPVAGFSGPAGAQAKFCGPFSGGKFCPQVGPQAGPWAQPGPKPNPHPGLTKAKAQGGWGKVCVCAHLGPNVARDTPGRSFICVCKRNVAADGNVFSLSAAFLQLLQSLKSLELLFAEIAARRDFAEITEIVAGVLSFYQ